MCQFCSAGENNVHEYTTHAILYPTTISLTFNISIIHNYSQVRIHLPGAGAESSSVTIILLLLQAVSYVNGLGCAKLRSYFEQLAHRAA